MFSRALMTVLALLAFVASATAQAPNPPPPPPQHGIVLVGSGTVSDGMPAALFTDMVDYEVGGMDPSNPATVLSLADGRNVTASALAAGDYLVRLGDTAMKCRVFNDGHFTYLTPALRGWMTNRNGTETLVAVYSATAEEFDGAWQRCSAQDFALRPGVVGLRTQRLGMWPNGSHPEWPAEFEDRFDVPCRGSGIVTIVSPELGRILGQVEVRLDDPLRPSFTVRRLTRG